MCTVSFVPTQNQIILTSNRDEHKDRPVAETPNHYDFFGKKLVYPRDPIGKGTWFVVNENNTIVVLLNGAEEKHISTPPYRMSRGQIVLQIAGSEQAESLWGKIDLNEIEPFTIILFTCNTLFQLRWNGEHKSKIDLPVDTCHFWSSSTLYSKEVRAMRENWFEEFKNSKELNAQTILDFHTTAHTDDRENGLVITRTNGVQTLSVCQAIYHAGHITFNYHDLRVK